MYKCDTIKLKHIRKRKANNSDEIEENKNHPLFIELSKLFLSPNQSLVWRESARWLKFVEVVDDCGAWSKPHVATISLNSLVELRRLLSSGIVFLDHKKRHYADIINDIVTGFIDEGLLEEKFKTILKKILLLPHTHQYQKEFQNQINVGTKSNNIIYKCCTKKNKNEEANDNALEQQDEYDKHSENENNQEINNQVESESEKDDESLSIDLSSVTNDPKSAFKSFKMNKHFMKKIPNGSKAATIMLGELDFIKEQIVALVKLEDPILIENLNEVHIPTKYLFIALGPVGSMIYIDEIGKCISTLLSDELFQNDIHTIKEKANLILALDSFLDQSTILPPGQWDNSVRLAPPAKLLSKEERLVLKMLKVRRNKPHSDGHADDPCLQRTGKFCGGLIADIKRKAPWYLSDFKDALNFQCIPAIAFLYFACLTPIITFGGLLGYATDQNMGAIESLLSGLICGVSYSLFSGQPMTIMGSTGPVLVFETILNDFSKKNNIDYMGFRCWVGLWIFVFLTIITLTDLSFLVKYITRFTEELFAILIALIFVHESIDKLIKINKTHHFTNNPFLYQNDFNQNSTQCFRCVYKESMLNNTFISPNLSIITEKECHSLGNDLQFLDNCKHIPDVFFFSIILYLLTFIMAMTLRDIKFSTFFPTQVRSKLSNFGVIITISVMVCFDMLIGLDTPKLHVPSEFHPTIPDRGWFINPIKRQREKWWLSIAAIIPALLATILIFMDQHITAVIINRKSNKLKKSAGYHLDLLICSICILVNSFFGLPWFVAATVLSMNHVIALRKVSSSTVPGEPAKLVGVIEQRVTGCVLFILIGCSIFITNYLALIPMAVLYAIFMYMGVTPMSELEFFQRMLLLLSPRKHQPDCSYLRNVRISKVHLFTFIQIVCLIVLFVLKLNKTISITFPLMVLALVFIRFAMGLIFTDKELSYLDDIIPGSTAKNRKSIGINELNVSLLQKAAKAPSRQPKESFSNNLNEAMGYSNNFINDKNRSKENTDQV